MYVRVLEPFCDQYASGKCAFLPDKPYRVHQMEAGRVVLVSEEREICWVEAEHVRVTSEEDASRLSAADIDLPIRIPQSGPYTA